MSDTEQLARNLGETRTERQIVTTESGIDHIRGVDPVRHHDGADCVGVPFGFLGAKPQSPGGDRSAHAIGEDLVPLEYAGEPLLEQDVQRLPPVHKAWAMKAYRENSL